MISLTQHSPSGIKPQVLMQRIIPQGMRIAKCARTAVCNAKK